MRGCVAEGGLCTEPSPGTERAAERCHHPRGHTAEGTSGLQPATEPRGQTLGPINLNSGRGGRAGPFAYPGRVPLHTADCQNLPSAAICGAPGSRCPVRKIRFGSAGLHRNARPSLLEGKERKESSRPMLKQLLRGLGWVGKGSASSEIARGADRGGEKGGTRGVGWGGCGDPRSGAQPVRRCPSPRSRTPPRRLLRPYVRTHRHTHTSICRVFKEENLLFPLPGGWFSLGRFLSLTPREAAYEFVTAVQDVIISLRGESQAAPSGADLAPGLMGARRVGCRWRGGPGGSPLGVTRSQPHLESGKRSTPHGAQPLTLVERST